MARFSIVTISFNQAAFLERAIRSVIDQSGVELDYVVVDPGSTDGSRAIIERYRDRIATVILDPDKGPADGLNKGLAACTGELFGFLNADDELLPDALAEAAALFERHPEVDVVCGESWQVDGNGVRSRRLVSPPRVTPALTARGVAVLVQQSAFMRTAAIRQVGGFDIENRTSWDHDLFQRMARAGARFRRVDRLWALFRIYAGSISGSGRLNARNREEARQNFVRQFGRDPNRWDPVVARLLYVWETARDLHALRWKLFNRLRVARG